ncbi:Putative glucose-6-phosphate 1-epimerase [Paraliobacillus sp. PM-2]|uniref:aldose epimerase family protein n=1 Tax=Paraliobacillus sp. PM-2 TaxID=1462524 RepID=UPI00061C80CB|nr:hypothetical protein [Paraliobacillus sp. PM-2]CQR47420.1 Putative glucose-6-phosphate 1-epimerase [Paraliobacillus sp. PM-2]
MFIVDNYIEQNCEFVTIKNDNATCWLSLCLTRGGMVTELGVNGEELLYLNKATLFDEQRPIRGGIPILFPVAGKTENETYIYNEKEYHMPIHGFARDYPWEIDATNLENKQASITLSLESTEEMLKIFPFHFKLLFTYTLSNEGLSIKQSYQNNTNESMPMYAGFHPYFLTKDEMIYIQTDSSTYLDLKDNQEKEFNGSIKKQDLEPSIIFTNRKDGSLSIRTPGQQQLIMEYGPEFQYTVFWTEEGKNHVCMEPWMALPNALNDKKDLVWIESNSSLDTFTSFMLK